MRCYIVGGAVRDLVMGVSPVDRDWVVVGSSVEEMLSLGFFPVGKDFPVFLHPETKEEYALARTERKNGRGYKGFLVYSGPDVTLEDDLLRRDLTMNAMALDSSGTLIDPFGGVQDIQKKSFRHVSPAFSEDPLRVLRLARFSARYPDFIVFPDTLDLCRFLVAEGELSFLAPERIWQELVLGWKAQRPARMFQFFFETSSFDSLFEELGVCGKASKDKHVFFCSDHSFQECSAEEVFAYYFSEYLDEAALEKMAKRLRIPRSFLFMAKRWRRFLLAKSVTTPQEMISLFDRLDLWRNSEFIHSMGRLIVLREGEGKTAYGQWIHSCFEAARRVRVSPDHVGLNGDEIKKYLFDKRANSIRSFFLSDVD